MIAFVAENALRLIALALLLACSALFSSAETSLFNLTRHHLARFRTGDNALQQTAARLMDRPDGTLITILLGNITVNIAFFSIASVMLIHASAELTRWQSTLLGLAPLLAVILAGEVAPKVVAGAYPVFVAPLVAGPLYVFDRAIRPLRELLRILFVTPAVRLATPPDESSRLVDAEELNDLLEHSASEGVIAPRESRLLREVIELGSIKVREIAIPRVDMVVFDVTGSRDAFLDLVRSTRFKRIPVYGDSPENLVGIVSARDVLLNPADAIEDLAKPLWFVPETKSIDSLLRDFQRTGRELAVAVDEYGSVTGLITFEAVIEEVVGDIYDPHETPADLVQRLDENTYLVSGRLSIREWASAFGQRFADLGVATIGGLILRHLGRLARPGDTLAYRNLRFTVTRVRGPRIVEVRIDRLPGPVAPPQEHAP